MHGFPISFYHSIDKPHKITAYCFFQIHSNAILFKKVVTMLQPFPLYKSQKTGRPFVLPVSFYFAFFTFAPSTKSFR